MKKVIKGLAGIFQETKKELVIGGVIVAVVMGGTLLFAELTKIGGATALKNKTMAVFKAKEPQKPDRPFSVKASQTTVAVGKQTIPYKTTEVEVLGTAAATHVNLKLPKYFEGGGWCSYEVNGYKFSDSEHFVAANEDGKFKVKVVFHGMTPQSVPLEVSSMGYLPAGKVYTETIVFNVVPANESIALNK